MPRIDTESLLNIRKPGVVRVRKYLTATLLAGVRAELAQLPDDAWEDHHRTLPPSTRGVSVTENFKSLTLDTTKGYKTRAFEYPYVFGAAYEIERGIQDLGRNIRTLRGWRASQIAVQKYDHAAMGISPHKDAGHFWGVIAIASIAGTADLEVEHGGQTHTYPTEPGDLLVLRAPHLFATEQDIRPEHAVVNLGVPRISLTIRSSTPPTELGGPITSLTV